MFEEAARIKKEMDEMMATTNIAGFYSDKVHIATEVDEFVKTAIEENLKLSVETRGSAEYPFGLSFIYDDVKFFTICSFAEYEDNKDLIKKATE